MLRIKRWFAFDDIRRTEDLLDLRVVDGPAVELRAGAFVRRRGFNHYEFIHGGHSVSVDLNLGEGEEYLPTYALGSHRLHREYFSVVHIGEGDGWDVSRPCMASLLCFQGKVYLIDAGPNIAYSLAALGVSINEVDGIFHTHAHDDHFAGLTSLASRDHRIRLFRHPDGAGERREEVRGAHGQERGQLRGVLRRARPRLRRVELDRGAGGHARVFPPPRGDQRVLLPRPLGGGVQELRPPRRPELLQRAAQDGDGRSRAKRDLAGLLRLVHTDASHPR